MNYDEVTLATADVDAIEGKGGLVYYNKALHLPPAEPTAKTLEVYTLQALCDYLEANRDGLDLDGLIVHVVNPWRVEVLGPLGGRHRTRERLLAASAENLWSKAMVGAGGGNMIPGFVEREILQISLQALCTDSAERADLLKVLGHIADIDENRVTDDGVAQEITKRAGVASVEREKVRNPWVLCPFRTFREIEQPASTFVLRLRGAGEGRIAAALIQADGARWELEAVRSIIDHLAETLPLSLGVTVIG